MALSIDDIKYALNLINDKKESTVDAQNNHLLNTNIGILNNISDINKNLDETIKRLVRFINALYGGQYALNIPELDFEQYGRCVNESLIVLVAKSNIITRLLNILNDGLCTVNEQ